MSMVSRRIRNGTMIVLCMLLAGFLPGCMPQSEFNPDYSPAIAQVPVYWHDSRSFDTREFLMGCLGSWKAPFLRKEREHILNKLTKAGLFDVGRYVFIEGVDSNHVSHQYAFVGREKSRAVLASNFIPLGTGKFRTVFMDVDAAATRALFRKLDTARRNERQKDESAFVRPHFYCAFITLKDEGQIHRFAAVITYETTNSPTLAIMDHVLGSVDIYDSLFVTDVIQASF